MFYWHKRYASAIADLKKKKKKTAHPRRSSSSAYYSWGTTSTHKLTYIYICTLYIRTFDSASTWVTARRQLLIVRYLHPQDLPANFPLLASKCSSKSFVQIAILLPAAICLCAECPCLLHCFRIIKLNLCTLPFSDGVSRESCPPGRFGVSIC